MSDIRIKRIYEKAARNDGARVLVDRIWPRGVSKEKAALTLWLKEIAPSNELRHWYNHKPERWDEFRKRYFAELESRGEELAQLRELIGKGPVTLLFGSREPEINNATALAEYLSRRKR
jgi:uncharacterized protein YeaO (DUF488 family)